MAAAPFIDTNILVRHLRADLPDQSARATALIAQIEQGALEVHLAEFVIFETVFVLQRSYKVPKAQIRDALLPIIELPGMVLSGKRRFRAVFDLYVDLNIAFADAYLAVLMQQQGAEQIYSFDRELDRVVEITRVEP
jgi:predicted nucleic acid-binding protein